MDLRFTEEQDALVSTAREFTRKEIIPKAGHWDETGDFPKDLMKKAWETGLMNIEIPAEYGGLGGSCRGSCHRDRRTRQESRCSSGLSPRPSSSGPWETRRSRPSVPPWG